MEEVDRDLLAATGRARPRVAIIPTASWPDGDACFLGWIERGRAHFSGLGAEVEGVELRTRQDAFDEACAQAIGEADLVYLSGGKPDHLLGALEGTPAGAALWAVHLRGGIVAGCSAGAMVLAARQPRLRGRRFLRLPIGWRDALGLVEGVAVLPHYDAILEALAALIAFAPRRRAVVLGIDEDTAAVGLDGTWEVHGRGRVTVWRGRSRTRHRDGESFRLGGQAVDEKERPSADVDWG
jgi:cyanophycinase-like exopeptidase